MLQSHIDEAILWLEKARGANPGWSGTRVMLASAYALKGETKCAAAEFTQARKLAGEGRYESIARVKATTRYETPEIRALAETTYLAGLRNAAISEE